MAIPVTRVSTGEDFDIGPEVDARSRELMGLLHRRTSRSERTGRELVECRMHDDSTNPELAGRRGRCDHGPACTRIHGIFVSLVKRNVGTRGETWTVSHFDRIASHVLRIGEGDEHKQEKYEWCEAFSASGWSVDTEVRIESGAVCDVLVEGSAGRYDIEVQRSYQRILDAKGRTTRIRRGGVEPVWSAAGLTVWNENNSVPNVRTNDLSEAIGSFRPVRDEWRIVGGLRDVEVEPCGPRYGNLCPVKGIGRWCRGEHPRPVPMPGLRVYDVAERLPAGDIVSVTIGGPNPYEALMPASSRDLFVALGGLIVPRKALIAPDPVTAAQIDAACKWEPREGFGSVLDQRQNVAIASPICQTPGCGERLLLPRPGRVFCARCDPSVFRVSPAPRTEVRCQRCGRWWESDGVLCPQCESLILRGAAS